MRIAIQLARMLRPRNIDHCRIVKARGMYRACVWIIIGLCKHPIARLMHEYQRKLAAK